MVKFKSHETERILALQGSELASFFRRAVAFLIDLAVAAGLFAMIASLVAPLLSYLGWIRNDAEITFALNKNWYSIVWIVLYYGLATYIGNGQTPGKWFLGIRIVSLTHERMSIFHCIERALGYGYSLLEFFFGFIQYFIYPNRRTLHDRVAETIVIREKRKVTEYNLPIKRLFKTISNIFNKEKSTKRNLTSRSPKESSGQADE
jgi:uncharacterized RDD family membrane protein YckC